MTWVKVDDQLHSHPKIKRAWRTCEAALGLHLLALSHAGAYFPDGHVPEEFVAERLPRRTLRHKAVQALVDAELWEPVDGGWLIHGYLEANPLRARKAGQNGAPEAPPLFDHLPPASRAPAGVRGHGRAHARGCAQPDPTRPDPALNSMHACSSER